MEIKAHTVCPGIAEGEAIVTNGPFSFLGDIDPTTGKVPVKGHELEGKSLANKIFVFTMGKGSSGGPRVAWVAKKNKMAPAAIICLESEPVLSCSVIASEIPTVDKPDKDIFALIHSGDYVKVDANKGLISVISKSQSEMS